MYEQIVPTIMEKYLSVLILYVLLYNQLIMV